MNPHYKEVIRLLDNAQAVLVRQNGHKIFQFPDGTIWVTPSTPSDFRSWANNLANLKRRLGHKSERSAQRPRPARKPTVDIKSDRTIWREWLAGADVVPLGGAV